MPSVASLLNFDYLPALPGDKLPKASARSGLFWSYWIQNSRLFAYFRENGYELKTLAYFSLTAMTGTESPILRGQFYDFLRFGTVASALDSLRGARPAHVYVERSETLKIFQTIGELDLTRPTFVLAHVLCPHPPLVFTEDGQLLDTGGKPDKEVYHQFYPGQASFVGKRTLQSIDALLKASPQKPIIIVMSDHGSFSQTKSLQSWEEPPEALIKERMPNLCALYLPGQQISREELESICPVNTFRLILNKYFEAKLELLPRSSTWIHGPLDVTQALEPAKP